MLPLRFLTGEFNHPGHQKSTILVVTLAGVSQPYVHVRTEISYPGSRKFGLDPGTRSASRTTRAGPAVPVASRSRAATLTRAEPARIRSPGPPCSGHELILGGLPRSLSLPPGRGRTRRSPGCGPCRLG